MVKCLSAVLFLLPVYAQSLPADAQALLDRAKSANPNSYQYVIDQGAQVLPTSDGRTFYIFVPAKPGQPTVVSVAAPEGWATDDFARWHPDASSVGMGVLTIQSTPDLHSAADLHKELQTALTAAGITEGSVLLQAADSRIYEVAALDRQTKDRLYATFLTDGKPSDLSGYGYSVLTGTYWSICDPDFDSARATADTIIQFGGVHDAFLRSLQDPFNLRAALFILLQNVAMRKDPGLSRTTWETKRDPDFEIPDAGIPNAGIVNNEVWLTVSGQRLYRSADGSNKSTPDAIVGLGEAFANTGYVPTEIIPRQAPTGQAIFYVLALAPPGTNKSLIYRLVLTSNGFVRAPQTPVYSGAPDEQQFLGVPDVTPTLDGALRLTYIARGATRSNARSAISYDNGVVFIPEYPNLFGDLGIPDAKPTDINVDPAILKLSTGGYLAVTMRDRRLFLFTSVDGRSYVPVDQPPIEAETLSPGALGLYDPTLVQLPDGRIFLYATAGTDPSGASSRVVRAELVRIN